jgi:hypothetical protein
MNAEAEKFERLIVLAQRIIHALEADITALSAGTPAAMASLDPEIQRLTLLYGREIQAIDPALSKTLPAELRQRAAATTGKFRETLKLHQRLLFRMRHASEGIVKAIADEVQRQRASTVTYAPPKRGYRQPNAAMIFNGVV